MSTDNQLTFLQTANRVLEELLKDDKNLKSCTLPNALKDTKT